MKNSKKHYPNGNPRSLRCDILDWHKPDGNLSFDGCSISCKCLRCGRTILQDSQGGWFAYSYENIEAK